MCLWCGANQIQHSSYGRDAKKSFDGGNHILTPPKKRRAIDCLECVYRKQYVQVLSKYRAFDLWQRMPPPMYRFSKLVRVMDIAVILQLNVKKTISLWIIKYSTLETSHNELDLNQRLIICSLNAREIILILKPIGKIIQIIYDVTVIS